MSTIKVGGELRNFALRKAAERRAGKLIPKEVYLEVTYKCNLKCIHCGLAPYLNQSVSDELTFTEIMGILDQIFESGALGVSISGGEPFCRPDLFDILEHANKIGLFFGIKTNGTLLTETMAKMLKKLGVTIVPVSLYGAMPEIHEYVTGVPGSFEKAIHAIQMLKSCNVRTGIRTSLMKCNFSQNMELKALADKLGVSYRVDPMILPKFGQPGSAGCTRMSDEQLRQLILQRNWINLDNARFSDDPEQHLLCAGGRGRYSISPRGEVFPCPSWPFSLGDLRQQSFKEISLGEAANRVRAITVNDYPDCVKCEQLKYCTRCPGMVLLENSGISGPSPESCRLARAIKGVINDEETLREPHHRVGTD